ncbi:hypothetical protein ABIE26_002854 [Pedobacter africanus]|uniref:Uncharacterized protein n=1 Tax=Pedobacter africanus TaxID=151894 RepID=A0ACC6KX83_9SPHI|nr:DUF6266 family protein [Pedobacter africanus]MDR6783757.1 hypothetical protein [Pedobacter africanus]
MGIIRQGIFDGFEGKTGPLVGRYIHKRHVISGLPHKSTKAPTLAQILHQQKFALVVSFFSKMQEMLAIGFPKQHPNSLNAAVRYNFKHVIEGNSPPYSINYSKVIYSLGKLSKPNLPAVTRNGNTLLFSWLPEAQNRFNRYTDQACFMVYSASRQLAITRVSVANRADLGYSMELPEGFGEDELHCYMSFRAGKEVSDSIYLNL